MGPQGLNEHRHTRTQTLTADGMDELELTDGSKIARRNEVAMRL